MPDYPDILDHLGKTPREFGSVQVHLEPLIVDDGWAWGALWFQAAYTPTDSAHFELTTVDEPRRVLCQSVAVPELSDGRVVRGYLRFKAADGLQQVALSVKSSVLPRAQRCRQAWKLFDTLELPKESELRGGGGTPAGINFGAAVVGSFIAGPLGYAVAAAITSSGPSAGPSLRDQTQVSVHKARELPDAMIVEVRRDAPTPPPGTGFSIFWRPGQPMPAPLASVLPPRPELPAASRPATGRRVCSKCEFSGKREDFGKDRFCPNCGHEWD